MNLDNQLLFFFSALGAFNSLLLSFYVFFNSKLKTYLNHYLAFLLVVLSIRIWKSIFFYFNPHLSKAYLQIGLTACFFIGPFLFLYVKSISRFKSKNSRIDKLHIFLIVLIVLFVGIIYPYKTYPKLWGDYFYKIINYQWLIYIIASGVIIYRHAKEKNNEKSKKNNIWIFSVFIGVLFIWIAYFFASYTSYIAGALSLSFVIYVTVLVIYYNRRKEYINPKDGRVKYEGLKIEETEANELFTKIDDVIKNKEWFKNPNLTLPDLAKEINHRPHKISQLLNDNLNKNFTHFINEYRIEEAKRILLQNTNLKIEIVAEMCGFNSNSTFYNAFKKNVGCTPAQFAKKKGD